MPEGDVISIDQEGFLAPEIFFNPASIGSEEVPMSELIYKAIQNCDADIRPHLYSNIVLSGGSTMFPSLKERLHNELVAITH